MSRTRVIEIHREIARLHEELAAELARDDAANDTSEPTSTAPPPKVRRRKTIPLVKPTGRAKPSDLDKKRAEALLKRHYGR